MFNKLPFDITGLFINKIVMGNKINLNEEVVIKEYLSGKSSLILAKEFNVSKPVILKILKKNNVTRKRDRCKSLKIDRVGEKYITKRICPNCKKEVDVTTTHPTTTCRNYFKTLNENSVCKKCLGDVMVGKGNPFYGKKHSDKTKEQISKSRIGKATGEKNSMANPEHREKARQCVIEWIKKTPIKYYNRSKKEKEIYSFLKTKIYNNLSTPEILFKKKQIAKEILWFFAALCIGFLMGYLFFELFAIFCQTLKMRLFQFICIQT